MNKTYFIDYTIKRKRRYQIEARSQIEVMEKFKERTGEAKLISEYVEKEHIDIREIPVPFLLKNEEVKL